MLDLKKLVAAGVVVFPLVLPANPTMAADDERAQALEICETGADSDRLAACSKFIELESDDGDNLSTAHFYRAEAYSRQGNPELAIADFTRSNEYFAHPTNNYKRGDEYLKLELYEEAIADYSYVIEKLPSHFSARNNRGVAYWRTNRLELAIADFDQAIAKDPVHAIGYYNRARAYLDYGKPASGLADMEKLIEHLPGLAQYRRTYGQLLEALGRDADAIASYQKAVELDPSDEVSKEGLARLESSPQ